MNWRAPLRLIAWRRLAVRGQLGDDAAHFAWQERLLDDRTAALEDKLAQCRGQSVSGHEDDAPGLGRPAPHDLPIEGAPIKIGHADIREDRIVVLRSHPLQRFASGTGGYHPMPRTGQDLGQGCANLRLVIDDEYRALARAGLARWPGSGTGRAHGANG